jgi:hypothetical protein
MCFTCVEVWRGFSLNLQQILSFIIKHINPKYERINAEDEYYNPSIYTELELINEYLKYTRLDGEILNPCCGPQNTIIIGFNVINYDRLQYNNNDIATSDLQYIDNPYNKCCARIFNNQRCGKYVVCDVCLGSTTNGYYPVHDILDNNIEIIEFCFNCLNDKCKCNNKQLTSTGFDPLLNEFRGNHNLDIPIKNYYRLDDCIFCT